MDNRWIRKTLQKAEPYVVPAISESIVINANESPYTIFDFPEVRRDYETICSISFLPLSRSVRGRIAPCLERVYGV